MQKTSIEYLKGPDGKEGYSWSPIKMRCSPVSAGCANCWHLRFAKRHVANLTFGERAREAWAGGSPMLNTRELVAPIRLRKSALIAVQFMGDLLHSSINPEDRCKIFRVMQQCPRHTFLLLTKRPEGYQCVAGFLAGQTHIWVGVSVEDQATADERIPLLLQTPAAWRWVSVEPCLGPVRLDRIFLPGPYGPADDGEHHYNALVTEPPPDTAPDRLIDFVVVGAETGPRKRPCRQEWIDSLREQCAVAGVKFFGKVDSQGLAIMPREMP